MNLIRRELPVDEAFALSTEAGWNQTHGDWQRLITLAGDGCFGITVDGKLAATAVAYVYEPRLAWIAMVLTFKEHRGKGYARTLMEQCLQFCEERRVACVKLDATDLGRPVYAKLGFIDERPVSRWLRPVGQAVSPASQPDRRAGVSYPLDLEAFGADRSSLLSRLAHDETYGVEGRGYAFGRPGRLAGFFGPCVAQDAGSAALMLQAFLAVHGGAPAVLDLCDDHTQAVRIAEEAGFRPVRHLMRMFRGDPASRSIASGELIYTLAGFEYG